MIIEYLKDNILISSDKLENNDYKINIINDNNRTKIAIIPKNNIILKNAYIVIDYNYKIDDLLYLNGYQSWTDTKEYRINEKLPSINKLPKFLINKFHFDKYGDYSFVKYKKNEYHSFTYSYIRNNDNNALLFGSYNKDSYLIIKYLIKKNKILLISDINNLELNNEIILFDYITLKGNYNDILNIYLDNFTSTKKNKLTGYSSWYNYYQDINEDKIYNALMGINNKDYNLFQIDDGYEKFVGDWLNIDKNKFPNGLNNIVNEIHNKGLLAGIWLAPFVVEEKSDIFINHKDMLYMENGRPVYAGCNWSNDYVLDIRKPIVKEYIKKSLEYYINLGFDLFKLDFLYSIALINDSNNTRCQIMEMGMKLLRDILKDKLILGCGVPLFNAFSIVDYCRIGPDVSLIFDDTWYMKFMHRERISTKVNIVNTIYRSHLDNKVFLNDPDVYLLRDNNIKLNNKQKEALITINHLCGSVYLTSDNVNEYDDNKRKALAKARLLANARILDIYTKGNIVEIDYLLDNNKYKLFYNIKKGIING